MFSRQRQGCQLNLATELAVFNASSAGIQALRTQDRISGVSAGLPQDELLDVEPGNISAKDREVMTERMKDSASESKDSPVQPFSDSVIEMEIRMT